jgi:hypothetical protein
MGLEGLGKLKKSNDLIGNRIPDHLAGSIVPQPTGSLYKQEVPQGRITDTYNFTGEFLRKHTLKTTKEIIFGMQDGTAWESGPFGKLQF